MLEFFNNLNFSQMCFYVAIFATVLFVVKMILFAIGGDGSDDMGIDITDTDASFSLISVQGIFAFFMAFGWCGWIACEKMFLPALNAAIIAIFMGAILLCFTAILMGSLKKLNRVVETDLKSLIGQTGTAYTKFEPDGNGQIQIELNEKLATLPAINKSNEHIEFTDMIKVMDVVDDILYIEKV
jgi:hypothetical protein